MHVSWRGLRKGDNWIMCLFQYISGKERLWPSRKGSFRQKQGGSCVHIKQMVKPMSKNGWPRALLTHSFLLLIFIPFIYPDLCLSGKTHPDFCNSHLCAAKWDTKYSGLHQSQIFVLWLTIGKERNGPKFSYKLGYSCRDTWLYSMFSIQALSYLRAGPNIWFW